MTEPSLFIDRLRDLNIILSLSGCFVLMFLRALPNWNEWTPSHRLNFLALFNLCFSAAYATFEVSYMDTQFRVPMITVSLIWVIAASLMSVFNLPRAREE